MGGFLGTVLLATGLAKLRAPQAFRVAISGYRLIPVWLVRPIAAVVPLAEVALGTACLIPASRTIAFRGAVLLLTSFAALTSATLLRGDSVGCGCGIGNDDAPLTWAVPLRNGALILLAVLGSAQAPAENELLAVLLAALIALTYLNIESALASMRSAREFRMPSRSSPAGT